MERLFIEVPSFQKTLERYDHSAELLLSIQQEILKNPETGDLVQGCSGVRKLRVAAPSRQKGKRGGFRVLYLDLPERAKTWLIHIYGKNEADDISEEGKKTVRNFVSILKKEP